MNTTSVMTTDQNANPEGEWFAKPFDAPPNSNSRVAFFGMVLSPVSRMAKMMKLPSAAPMIWPTM